jgi:hypothetical protein
MYPRPVLVIGCALDAELWAQARDAESALFADLAGFGIVGGISDADRLAALDEVLVDDDDGGDQDHTT